jgi:hypothetical protein
MWILPKKNTIARTCDIWGGYCSWSIEDRIHYGMAYP